MSNYSRNISSSLDLMELSKHLNKYGFRGLMLRELKSFLPSWLTVWIDEDQLIFGTDLEHSLKDAINTESDYVILFLSNAAVESMWVRKEIKWALTKEEELGRVFLLPVTMENAKEHLHKLNLEGKFYIELSDFSKESTKLLANKITDNIARWINYRLQNVTKIEKLDNENSNEDSEYSQKINDINNHLNRIPSNWRSAVDEFILSPYFHSIKLATIGEIPVNTIVYYQSILGEMERAGKGTEVYAVSTLSSDLWGKSEEQSDYLEKNFSAAIRGAKIKRLFVYDGNDSDINDIIQEQLNSGIEVKISRRASISVLELEDIVLFKDASNIKAFICHRAIDHKRRVRGGKIVIDNSLCEQFLKEFNRAWSTSEGADIGIKDKISFIDKEVRALSPGKNMKSYSLEKPVVTCQEASEAKGIPLANELKTLILETSSGLVACHLSGNSTLWLRAVKDFLEADEACLVDPETLQAIGLSPGTVSAVLDPVWEMPHLISREVLKKDMVSTNNGTKNGYYTFHPSVLTMSGNYRIGDIEKQNGDTKKG